MILSALKNAKEKVTDRMNAMFGAINVRTNPEHVIIQGMGWEAETMLEILDALPNVRVPKSMFIDAKIYNPGRPKSKLVRKFYKCIICKKENNTSYWMQIKNLSKARSNMTEKEIKKYCYDHPEYIHL